MSTAANKMNNEPLTLEKLLEIQEMLKPKKMIITNDIQIHEVLLNMPFMDRRAVKFSPHVEGTYMIDLEKLEDLQKPKHIWPWGTV